MTKVGKRWQSGQKKWQKLAKIGESWQKMSEIVRSCPMLPKVGIVGKSWQRLAKDGKSWQKLSKVGKSCQKLSKTVPFLEYIVLWEDLILIVGDFHLICGRI